jgi:hypothetical protein
MSKSDGRRHASLRAMKGRTWWPSDSRVPVQDAVWRIVVPLDGEGAPGELDPAVQYMLRAWTQDNPSIEAAF